MTDRNRTDGWEDRLLAAIDTWKTRPFAWGGDDCLGFGIACIGASHPDWSPGEIPPYDSEAGATEALAALGFSTVADALASRFEACPVSLAQRGDVGVYIRDGVQTAVVCMGAYWFGMTMTGLARVPREAVTSAFQV